MKADRRLEISTRFAKQLFLMASASLILAACATTNHSIGSLQFNHETEEFPEHYRETTLEAIGNRQTLENQEVEISEPKTTIGATANDPLRWYVCITGLRPVGEPPRDGQIPISEHVERLAGIAEVNERYEVIVIFQNEGPNITLDGYDSRLCRDPATF